jgi:hypothetical protein
MMPVVKKPKKNKIKWSNDSFIPPQIPQLQPTNTNGTSTNVLFPFEYFNRYVSHELFEQISNYTNIYAMQQDTIFKPTFSSELKVLIALHIIIGCLNKFPRVKMYWETVLGIGVFLENMTRDRFSSLRTNLYLVNNLDKPEGCSYKFFKVRPLMDSVRIRCQELEKSWRRPFNR